MREAADVKPQSVEIAFTENAEAFFADRRSGLVNKVEIVALLVDFAFRRVDVFCRTVSDCSASEGDDFAGEIFDGEDQASSETVITSTLALNYEASVKHFAFMDSLF